MYRFVSTNVYLKVSIRIWTTSHELYMKFSFRDWNCQGTMKWSLNTVHLESGLGSNTFNHNLTKQDWSRVPVKGSGGTYLGDGWDLSQPSFSATLTLFQSEQEANYAHHVPIYLVLTYMPYSLHIVIDAPNYFFCKTFLCKTFLRKNWFYLRWKDLTMKLLLGT